MWFLRIWVCVLAVVIAILLSLALLLVRQGDQEQETSYATYITDAQKHADLLLHLDTHRNINAAAKIASDELLAQILSQLNLSEKEARVTQHRVNGRLLELLEKLKTNTRPELLIAVDHEGKQIAHIGPGESTFTPGADGLLGFPLVSSALRGYKLDDTWSFDGKLFIMAAAPIVFPPKDRIVGALLLGQQVDDQFVTSFKKRLDKKDTIDLAFFLRGRLMASTITSNELIKLPTDFQKLHHNKTDQMFVSSIFPVSSNNELRHLVIMTSLPGEAASHDAFYAIVAQPPLPIGLDSAWNRIKKSNTQLTTSYLIWITTIFLALLVVGLLVISMGWVRPANRFTLEARRISKGELGKFDEKHYPGKFKEIAKSFNQALQQGIHKTSINRDRGPSHSQFAQRDMESDAVQIVGMQQFNIADDEIKPAKPASEEPSSPNLPIQQSPISNDGIKILQGFDAKTPQPPPTDSKMDSSPNLPLLPPVTLPPLEEPVKNTNKRKITAKSFSLKSGQNSQDLHEAQTMPGLNVSEIEDLKLIEDKGAETIESVSTKEDDFLEDIRLDEDSSQDNFEELYEKFLLLKRECGETTDNLSFEKFAAKLEKNRAVLIEQFDCPRVKFQVYIKDGKAAIKATPMS